MVTEIETEMVLRLIASFALSGLIGFEREVRFKPAGLRTHMLVGAGSTVFTVLSLYAFPDSDPARVAASIAVGIGFIGAGTIYKSEKKIVGLTTASTLWITAAMGMAVGVGYYLLATVIAVLAFLFLELTYAVSRVVGVEIKKKKKQEK